MRLTFGGFVALLLAGAGLVIGGLYEIGSHAAVIKAGMGTFIGVVFFAGLVAGVTWGLVWLARNRNLLIRRCGMPEPGRVPVGVQAEQVPVAGSARVPELGPAQVPALPPGSSGPVVVLGLDRDQIGALLRDANLAAAAVPVEDEAE
jgi:hypothetical protein